MNAPNPLAVTAAVLLTAVSLLAFNHNTPRYPVAEIDGIKVINLAPVVVHPTAQDRCDADMLGTASLTAAGTGVANMAESGASLIGAQLSMPYYSFGTPLTGISKE